MSTAAQIAANLVNAQASTGPRSEEGKERSSLNALKTGLTGRTVLMPGEEDKAYQDHVCRFIDEFSPATAREEELVQSLADTRWRLLRIPALEANLYALGKLEFGEKFSAEAGSVSAGLIQAHIFLTYQKQFNNLVIQEARLFRRFDKEMKELKELQAERSTANARNSRRPPTATSQPNMKTNPSILSSLASNFQLKKSSATSSAALPSPLLHASQKQRETSSHLPWH